MMTSKKLLLSLLVMLLIATTACSSNNASVEGGNSSIEEPIVFGDAGWDSIRWHNEVAGFIIENGYGYETDVLPGSTPATMTGLESGDIDVYMELWTDTVIDEYSRMLEEGDIQEVTTHLEDNAQGFYVPTFVIEELAPDLKSVSDLPKYWDLFKDPEDPSKGRIFGAIPGWEADTIMSTKMETYGLDEQFNYFRPGSDTAIITAIKKAVEKKEPWVGYYFEPTFVIGKYDMTLLEEPEYSDEKWDNGYASAFPANKIVVSANTEFANTAPEIIDFLSNYYTNAEMVNSALAYMEDNDATTEEAAIWFLQENPDLWKGWVPEEVATKVENAF